MKAKGLLRGGAVAALVLALAAATGCSAYTWRPTVPEAFRTVSVPTFRNESNVTELGSKMSTQLLREFQREGTFKIRRAGDAALEVQGIVKSVSNAVSGYDRRSGLRVQAYDLSATVVVSVVDKRNGRVLIDNRTYTPMTTFTANQDLGTARRDASGRLAEDLARLVVDDVVTLNTAPGESEEEKEKKE